jgi:hypothetical protein
VDATLQKTSKEEKVALFWRPKAFVIVKSGQTDCCTVTQATLVEVSKYGRKLFFAVEERERRFARSHFSFQCCTMDWLFRDRLTSEETARRELKSVYTNPYLWSETPVPPGALPADVKEVLPLEKRPIFQPHPVWAFLERGELGRLETLRTTAETKRGPERLVKSLSNAYLLGFCGSMIFQLARIFNNIRRIC